MNFSNWKTMLFRAQGRIRRRDYWLWSIGVVIAYIVIYIAVAVMTGSLSRLADDETPLPLLLTQLVLTIPSIWIGACLGAKRWHDRDKSGWMYLILLIPIVGPIWTFVECGCLDGTKGPNKYGPSPKGIGAAPDVF